MRTPQVCDGLLGPSRSATPAWRLSRSATPDGGYHEELAVLPSQLSTPEPYADSSRTQEMRAASDSEALAQAGQQPSTFQQQPADGVGEELRIDEQDGNQWYGEQDGQVRWSRPPSPLRWFDEQHSHARSDSAVGDYQPQHQSRFPHPHREACDQDYHMHIPGIMPCPQVSLFEPNPPLVLLPGAQAHGYAQVSYGQPQSAQQPHGQPQYYAPQQALAQAGQQPSMHQPGQQAGYATAEYSPYAQAPTGIPGIMPYPQVPFPAHLPQLSPMPPDGIGLPMAEQALSRPRQAEVSTSSTRPSAASAPSPSHVQRSGAVWHDLRNT